MRDVPGAGQVFRCGRDKVGRECLDGGGKPESYWLRHYGSDGRELAREILL